MDRYYGMPKKGLTLPVAMLPLPERNQSVKRSRAIMPALTIGPPGIKRMNRFLIDALLTAFVLLAFIALGGMYLNLVPIR